MYYKRKEINLFMCVDFLYGEYTPSSVLKKTATWDRL